MLQLTTIRRNPRACGLLTDKVRPFDRQSAAFRQTACVLSTNRLPPLDRRGPDIDHHTCCSTIPRRENARVQVMSRRIFLRGLVRFRARPKARTLIVQPNVLALHVGRRMLGSELGDKECLRLDLGRLPSSAKPSPHVLKS